MDVFGRHTLSCIRSKVGHYIACMLDKFTSKACKRSFIVPIFLKDKAITNMERDLIVIISNLRDKDHLGMRTEKAVVDSYGQSKQFSRYLLFTVFCSSYVAMWQ